MACLGCGYRTPPTPLFAPRHGGVSALRDASPMRPIDLTVADLAPRQHGLVARDQLLVVGSRDQITRRLKSGRLIRIHDSVYRVPSTACSWRQALLAACLAGGKSSVASFRAAALLHGLPGGAEVVEITTLRHHRWPYPHVVVHESRHLSELDVMIVDSIPVTRAARTLCDLAGLVELRELGRRSHPRRFAALHSARTQC